MHHGFQNSDKVYSWEDLLESREQIKKKQKTKKTETVYKNYVCAMIKF